MPDVQDSIVWIWTTDEQIFHMLDIGFNSEARITGSTLTSFGKQGRKINARCMPGYYCMKKFLQRLHKRGWSYHVYCVFCNEPLETGLNLSLLCPFAEVLWTKVLT